MKKIIFILVTACFIISMAPSAFAKQSDKRFLPPEDEKADFMALVDKYVTKDQQAEIIVIREAYYAKIAATVEDARVIRAQLVKYEGRGGGDMADHVDPAMIETLKAALYEKDTWLKRERTAFEEQCKQIAPKITKYILRII